MKREFDSASYARFASWFAVACGLSACNGPPAPFEPDAGPAPVDASPEQDSNPPPPQRDAGVDAGPRPHVAAGPGIKFTVSAVAVDASGTVVAHFTVTDGSGVPLDYAGVYTDGAVSAKFILSALDSDGGAALQYTAYTKEPRTSLDGGATAPMPGGDTGGTLTETGEGQGTFTYTLGTKLPPGYDKERTHTLGVAATRDFDHKTFVANALFNFVPSGAPVTITRDIVTTIGCNQCHNPLGYHEKGATREVGLCVLCHSAGVTDVSNGESLDMRLMIHKIHRGKNLPSVVNGGAYQLTGYDPLTGPYAAEHADTWFPGELQNCKKCHVGSQGDRWSLEAPTRALCTTCHDGTSFVYPPPAGMTLHPGGQQANDSACAISGCHGTADRYSVANVHMTASTDPQAPVLTLAILNVDSTAPGETPVVHFSVGKGGVPLDILGAPLTSLGITIAGPTTDYAAASPTTYTIQGVGSAGTLAQDGAAGYYTYTFPAPIPGGATGSYALGMEGYLRSGSRIYAALNPVAYVAVTGSTPVPRRTVVDRTKCNACHTDLVAHGGTRKSPEYCVLCHTPNMVNEENVSRFQVASTVAESLNFKVMVHKIHRGSDLANGYVIGLSPGPTSGNPGGTPVDFGKVRFPGNLRACWACHAAATYLPPLPDGQIPTVYKETLACTDSTLNPASYCSTRSVAGQTILGPVSAGCVPCHDANSSVAHVQVNTAMDGTESCITCHGEGRPSDAQVVHSLSP